LLRRQLPDTGSGGATLTPLTAGVRGAKTSQDDIDDFVEAHEMKLRPAQKRLRYDMVKSLGIAGSDHRIQAAKRAQTYISGE